MIIRNTFEKLFVPRMKSNDFSYSRYIKDLEANEFRDKFNFGVCDKEGGQWLLQDFVQSPNALYVGGMGSGKSVSCRFTVLTWLLANSDKTIVFIVDTLKGAQDYKNFFQLSQVYEVVDSVDGLFRVIEMAFDEMMARNRLFKEVGVESIATYEQKTKKKMNRIILLMEEFHSIPNISLEFDKNYKIEGTHAQKFHTIMRVGRAMGVWVVACTQKSTSSDIPSQMVNNFTNKNIFKVSKGESNYVLGNDKASSIRNIQKGRCFTEQGEVQFPFVDEPTIKALLKLYVKENDAECALLTSEMITDILAGEVYKHKKISELVKNFEKSDTHVVISRLNKMMGNSVETLRANKHNLSHIVTWKGTGKKYALMIKTDTKKLQVKHIQNLIQGITSYGCIGGILYTNLHNIPISIVKFARDNFIEIVDGEDLIKIAQEIEEKSQNNEELNFKPDELADPTKESGEYQREKGIPDQWENDDEESLLDEVEELFKDTPNRGYGNDELPIGDTAEKGNQTINTFVDSLDIDRIIDEKVQEMEESSPVNQRATFDPPSSGTELAGIRKQKWPTLNMTFKLTVEEFPSLLVNTLRNESGEVYLVLFYVLLKDKIKHKYYLKKKIEGHFSVIEKKKLGIREEKDWNEDPLVLDELGFEDLLSRYLQNFTPCENPIYVVCWKKDENFVRDLMIAKSKHLSSTPTILETHIANVAGVSQTRDELIKSLNLRVDEADPFEEIEKDYLLWTQIV